MSSPALKLELGIFNIIRLGWFSQTLGRVPHCGIFVKVEI